MSLLSASGLWHSVDSFFDPALAALSFAAMPVPPSLPTRTGAQRKRPPSQQLESLENESFSEKVQKLPARLKSSDSPQSGVDERASRSNRQSTRPEEDTRPRKQHRDGSAPPSYDTTRLRKRDSGSIDASSLRDVAMSDQNLAASAARRRAPEPSSRPPITQTGRPVPRVTTHMSRSTQTGEDQQPTPAMPQADHRIVTCAAELDDVCGDLNTLIEEYENKMSGMKETLRALQQERAELTAKVSDLSEENDYFRARVLDLQDMLASKATPTNNVNSNLIPDTAAQECWASLFFNIRQCVVEHAITPKPTSRFPGSWISGLPGITRDFRLMFLKNREGYSQVAQALVWSILADHVFGNGSRMSGMFWSGPFSTNLRCVCEYHRGPRDSSSL